MIGGGDTPHFVAGEEFTAMLGKPKIAAQHSLGGRGAQADEDLGFDDENFGMKPRPTGSDLAPRGLLVQAALAARLPTKVLHGIRNIDLVARYSGFFE